MSINKKIKFAFHVHTYYSKDSMSSAEGIVTYCRKNNIQAIAICDHNEIDGAKKVKEIAAGNPKVIVCEEIKTTKGEIIGMFLDTKIDAKLDPKTTIQKIREQSGIVCLPHPGESLRREAIKKDIVKGMIKDVDLLETYNSRTLLSKDNLWAEKMAQQNDMPLLAGSDAHFIRDISSAINLIDDFDSKEEFLRSLKNPQLIAKKKTGLFMQGCSKIVKIIKKLNLNFDRTK